MDTRWKKSRRLPAMALCIAGAASVAGTALASETFFAPPQNAGSVEVKLYPMENVTAGTAVLVTFGFPLPRGSASPADLAKMRVLLGGREIASHVEMLTPWRHLGDAALDGKSVRVARVQIRHAFAKPFPAFETVTVEWGKTARAMDVPTLAPPRDAWHKATLGTFADPDNVFEPDVYAVLPKAWLCLGLLRPMRMDPFPDGIPETRDDPDKVGKPLSWIPGEDQMYAAKNFFFSIINEDDARDTAVCRYKTDFEPWLFDRSSAMFALHFRSGFLKPLREAVRSAGFYANHLTAAGFFDLKEGNDAKYSYNECLAYAHWLTGDDGFKAKVAAAVPGFKDVRTRWTPSMNFWTERHGGFKLLALSVAAEVLGGAYMDSARSAAADFMWLQNGADGLVPANRLDGALYHYGRQHDYDWAEDTLGASPWMSLFVLDPMVRVYALGENPQAADFIRRMALFLKNACALTSYNGDLGRPMDFPRYAVLVDGKDGNVNDYDDPQHALEVAAGIAYGHYFAETTGKSDPALKAKAASLLETYRSVLAGWIRPAGPASGLPAYRVSPWRQYNWQYRPSGSATWALRQSGPSGSSSLLPLPPDAPAAAHGWILGQGGLRFLRPGSAGYEAWIDPLGRIMAATPDRSGKASRSPTRSSP